MMLTYQCDRCEAKEVVTDGFVGKEHKFHGAPFNGKKRKGHTTFYTLQPEYRTARVVDVCGACYDEIEAARSEYLKLEKESVWDTVKAAVAIVS